MIKAGAGAGGGQVKWLDRELREDGRDVRLTGGVSRSCRIVIASSAFTASSAERYCPLRTFSATKFRISGVR